MSVHPSSNCNANPDVQYQSWPAQGERIWIGVRPSRTLSVIPGLVPGTKVAASAAMGPRDKPHGR